MMRIPLLVLAIAAAACDTHNSLTAPDSAYCPKTITAIPHADTTVEVSGPWTITIIHLWTEQRVSWVKCSDGTPLQP